MLSAFFYGVFLAFGLIIPLGVQNIFVFNQGASQPRFILALPSILTATFCDTVLILLAVLGVSVAIFALPWLKELILILGFIFLLYMGWVTWHNQANNTQQQVAPLTTKRQISFALSVSLLNPHALLDTIGVIGTNSLKFESKEKMVYTLGCIMVSLLWFTTLAIIGHFLKKMDQTGRSLLIINKISALIIWSVALVIAWEII